MILDRVEADRGDSVPDELTRAKFFSHLKDPLLWAFGENIRVCYFRICSLIPFCQG